MTTSISKLTKWTGKKHSDFIQHDDAFNQYIKTVDTDLTNLFLAVQRLQNYGFSFSYRKAVNDADYTALATDTIIGYTAISTGRTVTLPAAASVINKIYIIKDEANSAGTNNITVQSSSGNIDGSATNVINSNYGVLRVYSNGTNYFIF